MSPGLLTSHVTLAKLTTLSIGFLFCKIKDCQSHGGSRPLRERTGTAAPNAAASARPKDPGGISFLPSVVTQ